MLAACARRNTRQDEEPRSGAGSKPAASSTLRTDVAETAIPTPLSSPTIRRYPQCGFSWASRQDQRSQRPLNRRPAGLTVPIRPAASNELAMPAEQRLRLDREACPGLPRQRAAQHRQQRAVSPRQRRPCRLPAQDRQFVAKDEDLQLLRATRPRQQPHEREQIAHDEIHERPEQAALPRPRQEQRT
jgi:hypothetical protein